MISKALNKVMKPPYVKSKRVLEMLEALRLKEAKLERLKEQSRYQYKELKKLWGKINRLDDNIWNYDDKIFDVVLKEKELMKGK